MANHYEKQNQSVSTKDEGIFLYFEVKNKETSIVEYIYNSIIADSTQQTIDSATTAFCQEMGITLE